VNALPVELADSEGRPQVDLIQKPVDMIQFLEQVGIALELALGTGLARLEVRVLAFRATHITF
jgi:hypothetical protein